MISKNFWPMITLTMGGLLGGCQAYEDSSGPSSSAVESLAYNCRALPSCDTPPPLPEPIRPFHGTKPSGSPWHHGHDSFFTEGSEQWVLAKFTYGHLFARRPLTNEEIDIEILRGCGKNWEKLGTTETSSGNHPSIDGIEDDGGRVYFQVPEELKLGIGRHRLRLTVAGDHSSTELAIEVLPHEAPVFVSDVDGTLTSSEMAELGGVITNRTPDAQDGAAEALAALASKGYRPIYLSARPEPALQRTRQFIAERRFPAGRIELSQAELFGLRGEPALRYKTAALERLRNKGLDIAFAFGNTATDAEAYENAGIPSSRRFFIDFEDERFGGRSIRSYRDLNHFKDLPGLCHQI